jgi:hypothetical protein
MPYLFCLKCVYWTKKTNILISFMYWNKSKKNIEFSSLIVMIDSVESLPNCSTNCKNVVHFDKKDCLYLFSSSSKNKIKFIIHLSEMFFIEWYYFSKVWFCLERDFSGRQGSKWKVFQIVVQTTTETDIVMRPIRIVFLFWLGMFLILEIWLETQPKALWKRGERI